VNTALLSNTALWLRITGSALLCVDALPLLTPLLCCESQGFSDGDLTHAEFYNPLDVTRGPNNTVWVADEQRIRIVELPNVISEFYSIRSRGRVSTIAGTSLQVRPVLFCSMRFALPTFPVLQVDYAANSWLNDFVTLLVLSVFLAVVLLSLTTPFVSTQCKLRSHRMRLCAVNSWLDSVSLVYADAGSVAVCRVTMTALPSTPTSSIPQVGNCCTRFLVSCGRVASPRELTPHRTIPII
jgi:hypothetical protein